MAKYECTECHWTGPEDELREEWLDVGVYAGHVWLCPECGSHLGLKQVEG